MKQHTLTFATEFKREALMHNPLQWELEAVIPQQELKQSLLRKGYVVKEVRSFPVILTTCIAAKANVPRKQREALQKQIDEMPAPKSISLKFKK